MFSRKKRKFLLNRLGHDLNTANGGGRKDNNILGSEVSSLAGYQIEISERVGQMRFVSWVLGFFPSLFDTTGLFVQRHILFPCSVSNYHRFSYDLCYSSDFNRMARKI
jgi:hypothetical protein